MAALGLLIGLSILFGPWVFTYVAFRNRLVKLAYTSYYDRPAALLAASVIGTILYLGYTIVLLMIPILGFLAYALGCIAGPIYFIVLLVRGFKQLPDYRAYAARFPPPPLQTAMVDLYAGLFTYGTLMAILAALAQSGNMPESYVLGWAIYLLPGAFFGCFAALDAGRRSSVRLEGGKRAGYVALMVFLCALLGPLSFVAWWAWRRALWLASAGNLEPQANSSEPPQDLATPMNRVDLHNSSDETQEAHT
ncbi:MAG: hypothetical protein HS116_08880 [Planctomycetes bacterium]|nr:hypothetical protein [Planctomycetota bacterium]